MSKSKESDDVRRCTSLISAVIYGQLDVVRELIQDGVNIDWVSDGYAALHWAASNKNTDIVRALLAGGANVHVLGQLNSTPLHCTAHMPVVELLLEAGADVNIADGDGDTPLHLACVNDDFDVAHRLLRAGAKAHIYNKKGKLAREVNDQVPADLVEKLKKREGEVDDFTSIAPIHSPPSVAAVMADAEGEEKIRKCEVFIDAIREGNSDIVQQLIRDGVDIDWVGKDGFSALHWAASNGNEDMVLALLAAGADVNVVGAVASTPMHCATGGVIKVLLQAGADLNQQDEVGDTPLHWACLQRDYERAHSLLREGAKAHIRNQRGQLAREMDLLPDDLVDMLKKRESEVGMQTKAAKR